MVESNRLCSYLHRVWFFSIFFGLMLLVILPGLAQAVGCSNYMGKVVINEYNYIDNYIELKVVDPTVVSSSNTFKDWKLYLTSSGTADRQVDTGYKATGTNQCGTANTTYMRFNFASNDMNGTAIVVLKDSSGNEIDYFRISDSGSYRTIPASSCLTSSPSFPYPTNGPLNVNPGKKGILRFPDGTGNWIVGQGQGNGSEQSPCGSNDSLLSVTTTVSSSLVGIGSGSPFTWTAVVKNGGNNSLTNVQIVDELPPGLIFVNCFPSCSGNGSIANPYTMTIASLPAGASYTWSITTYATAIGSYTNDIGATATQLSPGYGHGIATVTAINASGFDHVRLNHTGSGVTCTGSPVTVTRCSSADDASGSCIFYSPSSALTGTVTAGSTNVAFTIPGGSSSTTVAIPVTTPQTVTLSVAGLSATPTNTQTCWNGTSASCSHVYSSAGFIFSNFADDVVATIPTQIAGVTSPTYYLRAVKINTTTKACEAALTGTTNVNFGYECNNPTSCSASNLLNINATTIARNNSGSVSSFLPVSLTFDANGNAPFTFNYSDVGQVKLYASKTASGLLLSTLSGSSNAFVVKPDHFSLSNIKRTSDNFANPVANSAIDAKFVKAGEAFTATVTALSSTNNVTPNFGRETAAEGVKLTQNLVLPSGGAIGALSNPTIAGGSFSNGVATVSNLAWDEVGIITLMPSIADADYLGAGDVIGTITGNIGRFYPDHFAITPGTATPYCGTFTYFGQDGFSSTGFVLKAQNLVNATTQNYTGSFAKLGLTWNDFVFTTSASLPAGSTLSASATAPTGTWTNGVATITAKHQISRPTALTGETAVTIKAKPVDSDGVTLATATDVAGSTPLRYGRVFLQNAYGSELLDLAMPMTAQYWNGNWVTNTSDSCTSGITLSLTDPNLTDGLATSELCVWDSGSPGNSGLGCSAAGTLAKQYQQPPASGNFNLNFKATGTANTGALDVTATVPAYLQFNWRGTGNMNPTARATFGVYKGHNKQIYFRELY